MVGRCSEQDTKEEKPGYYGKDLRKCVAVAHCDVVKLQQHDRHYGHHEPGKEILVENKASHHHDYEGGPRNRPDSYIIHRTQF